MNDVDFPDSLSQGVNFLVKGRGKSYITHYSTFTHHMERV